MSSARLKGPAPPVSLTLTSKTFTGGVHPEVKVFFYLECQDIRAAELLNSGNHEKYSFPYNGRLCAASGRLHTCAERLQ